MQILVSRNFSALKLNFDVNCVWERAREWGAEQADQSRNFVHFPSISERRFVVKVSSGRIVQCIDQLDKWQSGKFLHKHFIMPKYSGSICISIIYLWLNGCVQLGILMIRWYRWLGWLTGQKQSHCRCCSGDNSWNSDTNTGKFMRSSL